ncbi:hypothetical protein [Kaarinaea lacus]
MSKGIFDLVLQIIMMGGLVVVTILLVAPFINIGVKTPIPSPTQYVLEIKDSLATTRHMILGRIKKLLEQGARASVIEVVAVGDGANILAHDSSYAKDVEALMSKGVKFTVCARALSSLAQNIGRQTVLVNGVNIVSDGHVYAERLKDDGYIDELA